MQMLLRLGMLLTIAAAWGATSATCRADVLPKDDGYRDIWYANQPSGDEFAFKYSGGMATYPQQHIPIAYYSKEANKTFFCYGGTVQGRNELLHMVSYYDHATGKVPRPTILLNKKTDDAHDNPTLMLDDHGHIWIFSNAHGKGRPAFIHKSKKPYAIEEFDRVLTTNFSYSQPWHIPGKGFLFLHTRYSPGRNLFWMTSADGLKWNEPQPLARIAEGHYQISWRDGQRVGTAFNYHPKPGGLNARTNLYYLETRDLGQTWRTVDGKEVTTPLTEVKNPALVHDYQAEKLLVYLKDLQFDAEGRPVLLYLTSKGYAAGPTGDPRTWYTARWNGKAWDIRTFTTSDHNYDFGSIYLEADGVWRIIAPTEPGPQRYGTGGEIAMWTSRDQGQNWKKEKVLTRGSSHNHTYVRRPVNAHPDFYGLWADGDARKPSESALYFTNKTGDKVWRLPTKMTGDTAKPEEVVVKANEGAPPQARKPNVVLILTDNHGAWTLGCYGNKDIRTPHIDRLAREGALFSHCFSSNGVCSPTRATLLTGLIPSQHGVHCYLRAGEPQIGPKAHCTIQEFRSLPRILSEANYVCGLSGKWHLGGNLQPQEGFNYWVTTPHGHTTTFHDAEVIEGGKVRKEPTYLTDFWTEHGIKFIEQNKEKPFFLYLAYNGPYGLGKSLLEPARNRHADYYADKELKSFPREQPHPWLFNNKEYLNDLRAMRRYAAEISGVDDGVGRILEALKKHQLDENTLVVFTADQGLGGGQHGIWGMGDHTRPLHAFDETMHVPLIFHQPGQVTAAQRSDLLVSNYDLFPTLLDYLGLKEKLPAKPSLPGHSFAPALRGKAVEWENVVFYEFENTHAVRTKEWKYIHRFPTGPDELYDLKNDPGEKKNLVDQRDHATVQKQLRQRLDDFFDRYADPKFDLRRDGRSKVPLLTQKPKE